MLSSNVCSTCNAKSVGQVKVNISNHSLIDMNSNRSTVDGKPSNIPIFTLVFQQSSKICSVDLALISYTFLIRLINRLFNLHSNVTLTGKDMTKICDDFDLDNYLHSSPTDHREIFIEHYEIDDWCIIEDDQEENFRFIHVDDNSIIVTIKSSVEPPETFLRRATNWLHGSVQSNLKKCLREKEFSHMFDRSTGRLMNEPLFRQRVFDHACEPSIRRLVWCYLLRVFNPSMTLEDRQQYAVKSKERYSQMRQAWQNRRDEEEIRALENLIEKDVKRTDSSVKYFDRSTREKLLNILVTYCVYHPEPGYGQGMTDMATPILYVIRDESLSYDCFCALMRYIGSLFHSDGTAINRRLDLLRKALRAIDVELCNRIEQCDFGNFMFAYRWVLLDCKREFPFKDVFRVFESLWASLPVDRFELTDSVYSPSDHLCPSMVSSTYRQASSFSSRSPSPIVEDHHSESSSVDGSDSGYPDEPSSPCCDFSPSNETLFHSASIPFEPWLKNFTSIDDEQISSDMFTVFLCVALLEQNRSSIMQVSSFNVDADDRIGFYFTRLVRRNDAKRALNLARHYFRQYIVFQLRLKSLLSHSA